MGSGRLGGFAGGCSWGFAGFAFAVMSGLCLEVAGASTLSEGAAAAFTETRLLMM